MPQRAYDPEKAKFHLKEAGLTTLKVPLHAADAAFGGALDAAVLYTGSMPSKAGIDDRRGARAQRRLLVQRLDEQAVVRMLLGRPADRRLDVLHGLRNR